MAIANQLNTATTPISVPEGGSGLATMTTAFAPICAGNTATGSFNVASSGLGNSGWVLTSNGSAATPSFQAPATGTVTSVSGTANRITSTGGATPVIDISASYVGQSSITTLGTIATGVWNGTVIDVAHGGTGVATMTTAYAPLAAGTTATGPLQPCSTGLSTAGFVLTSNGSSALPSFQAAASGTVTSVSGTSNRITSTGGATPVIDISASYVGQSSITTLGTIGTGVWNGTTIAAGNGGTGVANTGTITVGGNTTFSGAFTFTGTITGNTGVTFPTSGTLQTTAGAAGIVNSGTANQVAYYASSGTTLSGLTGANGSVLVTNNTGVPSMLANPAAAGRVFQSANAAIPVWSTSSYADTYAVSTMLYASSANTVTGLATTNRAALSTNSTGVPTWLALTNGQIVVGSTAGSPAAATLTAGAGISITNASNSITVAATGVPVTVRVPMTLAQFLGMRTTPFQIIAAQGANTLIVATSIIYELNMAGVAFASGGNTGLQYGNTTSLGGPTIAFMSASSITAPTVGQIVNLPVNWFASTTQPGSVAKSTTVNTAVFATNATAAFTGGTGATVVITVTYVVITTT